MANVRRMVKDDVAEAVKLGFAMAQESPRYRDKGWNEAKVYNMTMNQLHQPNHGFFVTISDGKIIGMALGFLTQYFFSDEVYAADLIVYVVPEHRGSSAAIRLIKELENWAFIENNARELNLGISTGTNPEQTVRVYEKLGYKMCNYGFIKSRENV